MRRSQAKTTQKITDCQRDLKKNRQRERGQSHESTFKMKMNTTANPDKKGGNRVRPRFFDQVGHETMCAFSRIFSLNHVIIRLTKIMNNLLKHLNMRTFIVIFLCQKLVESFPKKFFYEKYSTRRQLLLESFFENFDF